MKDLSSTEYDLSFKSQSSIYLPLIIFFIVGAVFQLIWDKVEVFTYLNALHFPIGDKLFPFITYLGDGVTCFIILFALCFIRFGLALDLLISFLLTGIFVQGGKRLVFSDVMRPKGLLGEDMLHIIEGVKIHSAHSFPSGHSTTVMTLAIFLAIICPKHWQKIILIALGFLGGYSRIYISQHFFSDVYAGFAIALACVLTMLYWSNNRRNPKWWVKKIKISG